MSIAACLASQSSVGCTAQQSALDWPSYGPDRGYPRVDGVDGITNSVPDVVGPVDGSAKLTIFTEGNHYPVLLPLVLEAFPRFCNETGRCAIEAEDILIVTLPQVMIMAGLEAGGFRFGNMQLPVSPDDGPVYPDLVMLGEGPMTRLAAAGLIFEAPRVFTKHRGMGLLIRRDLEQTIPDLEAFAASNLPFVVATPRETGARRQYIETMTALLGERRTEAVFAREIEDFPGRVAIQHRDIPYAVKNEIAPVGVVFGHLARFYADYWPDEFAFVEIPEAAPFGSEILVAKTARPTADEAITGAFLDFLFQAAPAAYEAGGFMPADSFEFGRALDVEQ